MDYKNTLNLPNTKFSMKANLPQKEPEIFKKWHKQNIYKLIRDKSSNSKKGKFILHDGPPYANGDIHIGHALNKILKDIIVKFKTMRGYDSPFVPGWDCHGLPVEHELFSELGIARSEISINKFRKQAHNFAMRYVKIQKEQFKRLGVFGDWENPYLTIDPAYESRIIESFGVLVKEGFIYKGLKPVNWCFKCETALAEAEIEYQQHTSPSIYVKFKLVNPLNRLTGKPINRQTGISFLIWTTTPWTLLANVAVALHPDMEYALVKTRNEVLVVACDLLPLTMEKAGIKDYEVVGSLSGKELEGLECKHPFIDRIVRIVLADYISNLEGTGCVHTAPGHGQEDYQTGVKYNLDVIMPVDKEGKFNLTAGEFSGMHVYKANEAIISKLETEDKLIFREDAAHSYPHCWRCKKPIIFRATEQWFMSIDHNDLRNRTLRAINEEVKWIPLRGRERIYGMVSSRPDWCLSRQRYWGVPIPALYCKKCNNPILDVKFIDNFAKLVKTKGSDSWFTDQIQKIIPKGMSCGKCNAGADDFVTETDIIDVWFDSGVSHNAVLRARDGLGFPADLYLEGSDQHRGWFQSAIITGIGSNSAHKPPFKSVLTHGFVVDGEGKKMSKSLGNVTAPQEIIDKFGADVLRLWVASSNYNDDIRISKEIVTRLSEAYRKIRNTCRFILGNLYDFNPETDKIEYSALEEIDKWALFKLKQLINSVTNNYENYAFHRVYQAIYNFCTVEMSSFYLDILKDRLYVTGAGCIRRKSAQNAIYIIVETLVKLIAPILSYTAEEIKEHLSGSNNLASIHLSFWPEEKEEYRLDLVTELKWQELIELRKIVLESLEQAREKKIIGNSLEARLVLHLKDESDESFEQYKNMLADIFIVSQVEISREDFPGEWKEFCGYDKPGEEKQKNIKIKVDKARGYKCIRCWKWDEAVGQNQTHPSICPRCVEAVK